MQNLKYIFVVLLLVAGNSCAGGSGGNVIEICNDHQDNDGDGKIDCFDSDCSGSDLCGNSNNGVEICSDFIDNDGDGFVDCADPDCQVNAQCSNVEICNDFTDNDGDGKIDCFDPDCDNDPSCSSNNSNNTNNTNNSNTEICNDNIDNDNDGNIDCNDTDCINDANCQTATCTIDTLFYDSPSTCSAGYQCGVDTSYNAHCNEDSTFAGGSFYNACGSNGECPFGSICASDGTNPSRCMPFCQMDTHPNCPESGSCLYGLQNSTLNLCDILQSCTIVPNSCTGGQGCYMTGPNGDTGCFNTSNVAVGAACSNSNDCVPEAGCFNSGGGGQCYELCRKTQGNADCSSGTCQDNIGDATYGLCM